MLSLGQNELIAPGIILCIRPANERRRYNVNSSLIGWAYTQNDPCSSQPVSHQAINMWTNNDLWHGPLAFNIIENWIQKFIWKCCLPNVDHFVYTSGNHSHSSQCLSPHHLVAVTVHSTALHRRCLLPVAPPSSRLPTVAAVSLLVAVPLTVRRHVRGHPVVCKGHHQPTGADTAASGGGACTQWWHSRTGNKAVRDTNAHQCECILSSGQVENWPGKVEFCIEHMRDICFWASAPDI